MEQVTHGIIGSKGRRAPIMCEDTLVDELNTFNVRFDILNNNLAVRSTLPPKDRPLSVITVYVRKIPLRDDINKAAGHVLKTLTAYLHQLTFFTTHSHRRLFPPDQEEPPSPYLKGLLCMVLMTTTLKLSPPSWCSVLRNWFSSTIKTTSLSVRTLTSMPSEPTDRLPFTQSSHEQLHHDAVC